MISSNSLCLSFIVLGISVACSSKDDAPPGGPQTNGGVGGNPILDGAVEAGGASGGSGPIDDGDGGVVGPTILIPPNGGFGVSPDGSTALCNNDMPCACNNGQDDDGDGLIDGFDSECISAFDDNEETFATGVPGDNRDPMWQDCFFDGDSGAGNDGCRYRTECLTGELPLTDEDCTVTMECIERCQPLTPNGCDCFGCCTIPTSQGEISVTLNDACSVESIADETACPRCVPTDACDNPCAECELCLGKTLDDLPESCFPTGGTGGSGSGGSAGGGGAPNACDDGATPCADSSACASGQFCFQGCCQVFLQ
jgi:hypothetical protein